MFWALSSSYRDTASNTYSAGSPGSNSLNSFCGFPELQQAHVKQRSATYAEVTKYAGFFLFNNWVRHHGRLQRQTAGFECGLLGTATKTSAFRRGQTMSAITKHTAWKDACRYILYDLFSFPHEIKSKKKKKIGGPVWVTELRHQNTAAGF